MIQKYFLSVTCGVFLIGCVTTKDLSRDDSGLNEEDRLAAIQAATLTKQRCVKRSNAETSSKGVQIEREALIARLFKGNSGWYKAEARSSGTIDYVYYNVTSREFVCGEKSWNMGDFAAITKFRIINPSENVTRMPQNPAAAAAAILGPQVSNDSTTSGGLSAFSALLKMPLCADAYDNYGNYKYGERANNCVKRRSNQIGPVRNGSFHGVVTIVDSAGVPVDASLYEHGQWVRRVAVPKVGRVTPIVELYREEQRKYAEARQLRGETEKAKTSDDKPRWNNGQLMTTDAAEATAKVPTQQDVKPVTELEQLQAEAQQARREKVELEAQLAAAQQQTQVKPTALIGPRLSVHAIVIGNGAYQGSGRLDNPINDARAMSAKLRQMGFKVTTIENATRSKLVRALVGFNRSASATDVSMFFYAGHAAQISGINYMLPTDINMNDLSEVPLHGISLNSVIDQYLPGKTKLVFLDACRDNPLLQVASRSMTRGLAPISVSEGVMIAYATKDGSVAADGNGKNSPFTKALLQHIDGPDDISVVLRKVRAEVMQDTDGKQQPWDYNSLTGGSLILSAIRAK